MSVGRARGSRKAPRPPPSPRLCRGGARVPCPCPLECSSRAGWSCSACPARCAPPRPTPGCCAGAPRPAKHAPGQRGRLSGPLLTVACSRQHGASRHLTVSRYPPVSRGVAGISRYRDPDRLPSLLAGCIRAPRPPAHAALLRPPLGTRLPNLSSSTRSLTSTRAAPLTVSSATTPVSNATMLISNATTPFANTSAPVSNATTSFITPTTSFSDASTPL